MTTIPATIDLGVLTPRQRLVVTLHYYDNWTLTEIAEALRIGETNVCQCNKRALKRLRMNLMCSYRVDAHVTQSSAAASDTQAQSGCDKTPTGSQTRGATDPAAVTRCPMRT